MLRALRTGAALLAGGIVLFISSSCIEDRLAPLDRNRPPETFITGAPREGDAAAVNIHFFWRGYDNDGVVLSYVFAIDDTTFTNWRPTTRTDSVFLFRVPPDQPDSVHTFYIAAVDNDGKRDPTPAFRSFRATDLAPPLVTSIWGTYQRAGEAPVQFAVGDTVPAHSTGDPYQVTINWTGADDDGEIAKYFWNLGSGAPTESPYSDTTSASLGVIEPKDPEDVTRHVFFVLAEDNAGLRGGGGTAGIEPAQFPFTVDFTPRSIIDSLLVLGTQSGNTWDASATPPQHGPPAAPETTFYQGADLTTPGLTFPAGAKLLFYFRSNDPEDGCVKDIRWVASAGAMARGGTSGLPLVPGSCVAGTSIGTLLTDSLVVETVPSAPYKVWVRGRDNFDRVEQPGPVASFLVNELPVVVIDSVRVDPVTKAVTFRWHSTDPDQDIGATQYAASLDGGQRITQGLAEGTFGAAYTFTASYAAYDTTSGTTHNFVVEAANDLNQGRFSRDDTTFTLP